MFAHFEENRNSRTRELDSSSTNAMISDDDDGNDDEDDVDNIDDDDRDEDRGGMMDSVEEIPSYDKDSNGNLIGDLGKYFRKIWFRIGAMFCFNQTVVIEQPFPASLQTIVNFYRYFCLSFSGSLFVQEQSTSISPPTIDIKKEAKIEKQKIATLRYGGKRGANDTGIYYSNNHLFDRYHDDDDDEDSDDNEDDASSTNINYSSALKRLLMIGLNLAVISLYIFPFLQWPMSDLSRNNRTDSNNSSEGELDNFQDQDDNQNLLDLLTKNGAGTMPNMTWRENTAFSFQNFGHFVYQIARGYSASGDVAQLKPILRLIMQSLLYVYMANSFFTYLYALLFGGSLIRHLVSIREFATLDRQRTFGIRLVGGTLLGLFAAKIITVWFYQSEFIEMILFASGANESSEQQQQQVDFAKFKRQLMAQHFVIELVLATAQGVTLMMFSLLFIYSIVMFRCAIEQLQIGLIGATEPNEIDLARLKTSLTRLQATFKRTTRFFSLPVTLDLMANTYMLIGAACFLIINQDRQTHSYAISSIANIGLFALVRLVAVASVGNQPSTAAATLARLVYEAKSEWNLAEWLSYIEIKRAPEEFDVSMFAVYSIRQSSILTMLGFALNYIVILLQTENYGSAEAGAGAAAGVSLNGSQNANFSSNQTV